MLRTLMLGGLLAMLLAVGLPARAEDEPAAGPTGGVTILCEVWSSADPTLVRALEALAARDPADAAGARARLAAEGAPATRVCRFLTPAAWGTPTTHEDASQAPVTAPSGSAGGRPRLGFGGFVERGAKLLLTARPAAGGQVSVAIEARIRGLLGAVDAPAAGPAIPPGRSTVTLQGTITAPSGTPRMFQSNTHGTHTTYVFVTATRLP